MKDVIVNDEKIIFEYLQPDVYHFRKIMLFFSYANSNIQDYVTFLYFIYKIKVLLPS